MRFAGAVAKGVMERLTVLVYVDLLFRVVYIDYLHF